MKYFSRLFLSLALIGYGSLALAGHEVCWKDPLTGSVCCAKPGGITVCEINPGLDINIGLHR